ncbi:porin [Noviherbaspirillum saxi]|uniref:Porin n=1 Tax=Noviherbaspirillum saxi TaxID=2320863 RepID=A0A3A3FWA4_9BURK|nr:porin [Noviherbaspirillum saxi]RJF99604.1 porin [Noviherbaspirillum saxi]
MKKSLLALAVLGAFAGAASAQTNVTIYGVADVGIQRIDTDTTSARWGLDSGIQSGSRLGFKGSEDLGGGLSAIFTLESGYNIDTGTSAQGGRLFGRQAFVGLSGGFGAVKFGRQYTPIFIAHDTIDPFGTGIVGDASGISATFNPYGVRMDNTVNYSLTAGPISGQVAYGFGEVAGSTSANRQIGASLGYANGPLTVVGAYHDQNGAGTTAASVDARTAFIGGVFDLRAVKLHAAFADNRAETTTGGATTLRNRDYMLGVSAPIGAGNVMASYARKDDRRAGIANADADFWAVGYTHNVSKRTNLYTSYSIIKNDPASTLGSGVAGSDISWFNVGVRHKF